MNYSFVAVASLWVFFISFQAYGQDISIKPLPDTIVYKKYYADALAHQLSLSKQLEIRHWYGNIGGIVPLADVTINTHTTQVSLGATVFNTLSKSPGHIQVYTVEYLVEFFFDAKLTNNLLGRFVWGHLSAHYSDDGILEMQGIPINYVRDYAGLHLERLLSPQRGKLYAGIFYIYHNEPDASKRWTFQLGGDMGIPLTDAILLYGAIDCKIKSEVGFGSTQSYQFGVKYPVHSEGSSLRVAFTHRRGFEERGQLYNTSDVKNLVGMFIDF